MAHYSPKPLGHGTRLHWLRMRGFGVEVDLLHYDRDFDLIAGATGQPVEWIIPAGSIC